MNIFQIIDMYIYIFNLYLKSCKITGFQNYIVKTFLNIQYCDVNDIQIINHSLKISFSNIFTLPLLRII